MSDSEKFEALLGKPIFGMDALALLGDIEDFLDFSEANVAWQMQRELRRTRTQNSVVILDDAELDAAYKRQQVEGVEFRFRVGLTQRVRYSGLIAYITSIEWYAFALQKAVSGKAPAVHDKALDILSSLTRTADVCLQPEVLRLTLLVHVRNCIAHSAGLITTYKHAEQLRAELVGFSGIRIATGNFLGEGIVIDQYFLQSEIERAKVWLPSLEKALYEKGLLPGVAQQIVAAVREP